MIKTAEYLEMCLELGFNDLEGITLKWNRNLKYGNYITVERNGEELYSISDPAQMEKIAGLARSLYRSSEETELEEQLWHN